MPSPAGVTQPDDGTRSRRGASGASGAPLGASSRLIRTSSDYPESIAPHIPAWSCQRAARALPRAGPVRRIHCVIHARRPYAIAVASRRHPARRRYAEQPTLFGACLLLYHARTPTIYVDTRTNYDYLWGIAPHLPARPRQRAARASLRAGPVWRIHCVIHARRPYAIAVASRRHPARRRYAEQPALFRCMYSLGGFELWPAR